MFSSIIIACAAVFLLSALTAAYCAVRLTGMVGSVENPRPWLVAFACCAGVQWCAVVTVVVTAVLRFAGEI